MKSNRTTKYNKVLSFIFERTESSLIVLTVARNIISNNYQLRRIKALVNRWNPSFKPMIKPIRIKLFWSPNNQNGNREMMQEYKNKTNCILRKEFPNRCIVLCMILQFTIVFIYLQIIHRFRTFKNINYRNWLSKNR